MGTRKLSTGEGKRASGLEVRERALKSLLFWGRTGNEAGSAGHTSCKGICQGSRAVGWNRGEPDGGRVVGAGFGSFDLIAGIDSPRGRDRRDGDWRRGG